MWRPCFKRTLNGYALQYPRSTNLDSWSPEQLKMMAFGGNNRAHIFFKQHGWTDGGKIEAKYTSRAAELYRQILSKEVAKSFAEDSSNPSSPAASQLPHTANGLPDLKPVYTIKDNLFEKQEIVQTTPSPKAPIQSPVINFVKKPIGAKKTGSKAGSLGARKLTTKPNESLYNQKPEEPSTAVTSSANSITTLGPSYPSCFEYVESMPSAENISKDTQVIPHVAPPKSSSFPGELGMDNGFPKKLDSTTKVKVEESNEAGQKFLKAKSISSAQFFGNQNKASDKEAQISLQRCAGSTSISRADLFGQRMEDASPVLLAIYLVDRISLQVSQDISSLKNIAGETGRKLTSIASSLLNDI